MESEEKERSHKALAIAKKPRKKRYWQGVVFYSGGNGEMKGNDSTQSVARYSKEILSSCMHAT